MIRSLPSRFGAAPLVLACMAAAVGSTASSAQSAQPAPTTQAPATPDAEPGVRRISDAERAAILESATPESAALARGEDPGAERLGRGIHGEVGAMIGTGGARAIYGTAAIPLGDNAGAIVSFESSRFGYPRR
ncbi:hypothetical protein U1872_01100 [Sphingomonas sp. RB3P16]|uniref:hypothetical protein n=1 Tax=Parasphingomonas frigoris TaxID=3096163 RepID=UPI002FC59069